MFTGFLREMIAFFSVLELNNNREFFEENRELFTTAIRDPLWALAEALAPTISKIDPQMDTRPSRALSRIYRDIRFRKDKTPYRDHMWIGYRRVGESREEACGFYFDISAQAAHWGCGFYQRQQSYMGRLRETILARPNHVLSILQEPSFSDRFILEGERYTRQQQPPKNLPAPLQALYPLKSVYAEHTLEDMNLLFLPDLADHIIQDFHALAPFYELLRNCMVRTAKEE